MTSTYSGTEHLRSSNKEDLEKLREELKKPAAQRHEEANKMFRPSGERGFHHSDAMKAAEELRMEGKGSHDPAYHDSKKNK